MIVSKFAGMRIAITGAGDNGILSWIENPVHRDADATLARVRDRLHTPPRIVGERQGAGALVQVLARGDVDCLIPDADRTGSVSGWIEASTLAQVHKIPSSSQHKWEHTVSKIASIRLQIFTE